MKIFENLLIQDDYNVTGKGRVLIVDLLENKLVDSKNIVKIPISVGDAIRYGDKKLTVKSIELSSNLIGKFSSTIGIVVIDNSVPKHLGSLTVSNSRLGTSINDFIFTVDMIENNLTETEYTEHFPVKPSDTFEYLNEKFIIKQINHPNYKKHLYHSTVDFYCEVVENQNVMVDIKYGLPTPHDIDEPCGKYYVVKVLGFETTPYTAMYLKDENGDCGWYTSYVEKIIIPVVSWLEI